jgi:serine/threonine-protein phosphatase 2A regulatory subunit B''
MYKSIVIRFLFQEMEAYIRGLIPNLAQLRDMPSAFVQMYCRIAAQKFFFFCDPHRRGPLWPIL